MDMSAYEFEQIAVSEWEKVPDKFKRKIENVALLIEDEPSEAIRKEEGLEDGDTLLGLYHGIPLTERGSEYGVGVTLPDTITLFREPILEEAREMDRSFRDAVRIVVRETIWHEVGHYFGLPEYGVQERENEGTNTFPRQATGTEQ